MNPDAGGNRIDRVLADRPPGLWPFIAAGYPSLTVTAALLRRLAELPICGVEIGFPFSDPIADGPVIQNAFTKSLAAGTRVRDVFETVAAARSDVNYPILAMVSMSIICRLGVDAFVERARQAGFDGLIVPDVSLEEADAVAKPVSAAGMRLSMLVAPTTPIERQVKIARVASGFLYYVSVQGVTGRRDRLPADLSAHVGEVRQRAKMPVLVGFGISTRQHVRDVCAFADGAIVGSAIVGRMTEGLTAGRDEAAIVDDAASFIAELGQA